MPQPLRLVPRHPLSGGGDAAVTLFRNTSFVRHALRNILDAFTPVFEKRAFVFWFLGEGIEFGVMYEAQENALNTIRAYRDMEKARDGSDSGVI
jgi:hypothetical protein